MTEGVKAAGYQTCPVTLPRLSNKTWVKFGVWGVFKLTAVCLCRRWVDWARGVTEGRASPLTSSDRLDGGHNGAGSEDDSDCAVSVLMTLATIWQCGLALSIFNDKSIIKLAPMAPELTTEITEEVLVVSNSILIPLSIRTRLLFVYFNLYRCPGIPLAFHIQCVTWSKLQYILQETKIYPNVVFQYPAALV